MNPSRFGRGPGAHAALCRKFPGINEDDSGGDVENVGLGSGINRFNPFFTISLIEPNWIYTTVENSTVQTFDVHMLFSDTCERVDVTSGHPVQFSIIASP